MAAADVGVAMGAGAVSTVLAADAVVLAGSVGPLAAGIRSARAARAAVRRNMIGSVLYNTVAGAAAAAGLVNPLVAAVLMPLSSLWVVANALSVERGAQENR